MGILTQRVERSDLEAGDHIYTWRTLVFAYSHHGIYIGDEKVVHFTQDQNLSSGGSTSFCSSSSVPKVAAACLDFEDCGLRNHTNGVVKSCLNCFLGNGSLYRYEYGVGGITLVTKLRSGTCTTAKSDPPRDVIHKAMYLLENGYGKYDVLTNNCEDFALYCKTGLIISGRKGSERNCSAQVSSVAVVPASFILSLPSMIFSSNPYVFGATTLGTYTFGRYACDVGVRYDVTKVEVEDIAKFRGSSPADGVDISEDHLENSSSSSSASTPNPKFCFHNVEAEILTSETDANPYRRYYRCRQREVDDCKFFDWMDEELPEFQKSCVQLLKAERDWLDGSLKYKEDMEIKMFEQLKLVSLELEATKKAKNEAEGKVDELVSNMVEWEIMKGKLTREKKALWRILAVSIIVDIVVALYSGSLTSKWKFGHEFGLTLVVMLMMLVVEMILLK